MKREKIRAGARIALGLVYLVAGVLHLVAPGPFVGIVPPWVPAPDAVVALTGIAEIAGALCFIQAFAPHLHRLAGWVLAAYALCVWPANVQHMLIDLEKPDHGLGLAYHVPRMMLQPVLIWLALWAGKVIEWPFRR